MCKYVHTKYCVHMRACHMIWLVGSVRGETRGEENVRRNFHYKCPEKDDERKRCFFLISLRYVLHGMLENARIKKPFVILQHSCQANPAIHCIHSLVSVCLKANSYIESRKIKRKETDCTHVDHTQLDIQYVYNKSSTILVYNTIDSWRWGEGG